MEKGFKAKRHISSFQTIILGFLGVILLGAILLSLPFSSQSGEFTLFSDALFTSTSAVCVTGLVTVDTATHWSILGQVIILILIQIGGMGVVTVASSIALISGRKIGLFNRSTMQEAMGAQKVGGIVRLLRFILIITFSIELLGAALLAPVFCKDFGILKGIWMSLFHSISAFCNAGFDIVGENFSSLSHYAANPLVNVVIMLLIIFGGLGFLTWDDIFTHKFRPRKYRMQSKVVFAMTIFLVLLPSILLFFTEFSSLPISERILYSLFGAITPRTAGFSTFNLTSLSEASILVMIALMLIGGSSGSTAGGMKMTTVAVLLAQCISVFKRKNSVSLFKRRVEDSTVMNAAAIFVMYIVLFIGGSVSISLIENLPILTCMFEAGSAVATVGLSLGITPDLSIASQIILMVLMLIGRVGGLTIIYAAFASKGQNLSQLPSEKITVG